ncbi:MAG: hypothetical protein K6F53_09730 [Lachnospiraceae bacterium]|nr:hypothetical protein [Lachnospiraceae bacterium]
MLTLGIRQTLTVVKKTDFGVYLADTTDSAKAGEDPSAPDEKEVLLPRKEVPPDTEIRDPVEVFLYRDSEDRLIATTQDPYIHLGEVRRLIIKDVGKIGAFLDWGLPKDLLLPYGEQKGRPQKGESVDVRLYVDKSGRLCASMWVKEEEKKEGAYESAARALRELLLRNGGFLPLTDASSPEEIRELAGMSKKEFKRSVGNLYKNRLIRIEEKGIRLTGKGSEA